MIKLGKNLLASLFLAMLFQGTVTYAAEAGQVLPPAQGQLPQEEAAEPQGDVQEPLQQEPQQDQVIPPEEAVQQPLPDLPAEQPVRQELEQRDGDIVPEAGSVGELFEVLGIRMTATDVANVRSGPDTIYRSIGRLEVGQEVIVLGRLPMNWYQIEFEEDMAYVSGDYLQEMDQPNLPTEIEQSTEDSETIKELRGQIEQLTDERDTVRADLQVMKAANEELTVKLNTQSVEKEKVQVNYLALVIAGLFTVIFVGAVVILLISEYRNSRLKKTVNIEDMDDGLEVFSLSDSIDIMEAEDEDGEYGQ